MESSPGGCRRGHRREPRPVARRRRDGHGPDGDGGGLTAGRPPTPDRPDVMVEAVIFDWDGTAVPDRAADAGPVRSRVEALCAAGVHVVIVTGTHVGNVDGQLRARPSGPGRLLLCLNRGSEVFEVTAAGPALVFRRRADEAEDSALDRAAELMVRRLARRGLEAQVVSGRLNRRKIDLIPEPAWADPPKADIARLLDAVSGRRPAGRAGRPVGGGGSGRGRGPGGRAGRSAGHERRQARRDRADRQVGFGPLGGRLAGRRGGSPAAWSWSPATSSARRAAWPAATRSCSSPSWPGPRWSRSASSPVASPGGVVHLGAVRPRSPGCSTHQLGRRAARPGPLGRRRPRLGGRTARRAGPRRVAESLGSLANGWAGTRGAWEEDEAGPGAPSWSTASTPGDGPRCSPAPVGPRSAARAAGPARAGHRLLDLRTGVLILLRYGRRRPALGPVRLRRPAPRPGPAGRGRR